MEKEKTRQYGEFLVVKPIGSGGFGKVWLAVDGKGHTVALKVGYPEHSNWVEGTFHAALQHSHIIETKALRLDDSKCGVIIVMECGEEDLWTWISRQGLQFDNIGQRLAFLAHVYRGLKYLHEHGIAHLDLKPENVILVRSASGEVTAKIGDLGTAERITSIASRRPFRGTKDYWAPEILSFSYPKSDTRRYAFQHDYWCFGVMAYMTLFGQHPFYRGKDIASKTGTELSHLLRSKLSWASCTDESLMKVSFSCLRLIRHRSWCDYMASIYDSNILDHLNTFFGAIFVMDPERRTLPFEQLVTNLKLEMTPVTPPTSPRAVMIKNEEKTFPDWLSLYLSSYPTVFVHLYTTLWLRVIRAQGESDTIHWKDIMTLGDMCCEILGMEENQFQPKPPSSLDTDLFDIDLHRSMILRKIGFNVDHFT